MMQRQSGSRTILDVCICIVIDTVLHFDGNVDIDAKRKRYVKTDLKIWTDMTVSSKATFALVFSDS